MRARSAFAAGALALVTVAGVAGWRWVADPGAAAVPEPPRTADLIAVIRTDLTASEQVTGTMGYEGDWRVVHPGPAGVLTWAPRPAAVIRRGQRLYEVDGRPVRLLYGTRPVWRELRVGMPPGEDVRQLERNLAALGFAGVTVDTRFTSATAAAVRRWQARAGLPRTGRLALGTVVFAPGALRVVELATPVGGRIGGAVLRGSSTRRVVLVALPTARQGQVRAGAAVAVTLPGGRLVRGTVAEVGRVAAAPAAAGAAPGGRGQATIPVTVTLERSAVAERFDQAPVQVAVTTASRRGVLAVPVTALQAADAGGYEVIVAGGEPARRAVAVRPGLYDEREGLIEVSGAGLAEGLRVEVPKR
jgi:peptidoglycan hydrolase-like protein with peptidoglycan-binding domain